MQGEKVLMKVSFHARGFQRQLLTREAKKEQGIQKSAQRSLQFKTHCVACYKRIRSTSTTQLSSSQKLLLIKEN